MKWDTIWNTRRQTTKSNIICVCIHYMAVCLVNMQAFAQATTKKNLALFKIDNLFTECNLKDTQTHIYTENWLFVWQFSCCCKLHAIFPLSCRHLRLFATYLNTQSDTSNAHWIEISCIFINTSSQFTW